MVPAPHLDWLTTWSTRLVGRDGRLFLMRLLEPGDVELLTEYFLGLSDCTKMLYGPHPFDHETASQLCAERDPLTLRLVTLEEDRGRERIASYVILFLELRSGDLARYPDLPVTETASLAPSVRDDLQSSGLGSLVMAELIPLARRAGMRRMILCGGVQARNNRACHFYEKWGFTKVREFATPIMNYDMMREL